MDLDPNKRSSEIFRTRWPTVLIRTVWAYFQSGQVMWRWSGSRKATKGPGGFVLSQHRPPPVSGVFIFNEIDYHFHPRIRRSDSKCSPCSRGPNLHGRVLHRMQRWLRHLLRHRWLYSRDIYPRYRCTSRIGCLLGGPRSLHGSVCSSRTRSDSVVSAKT
ncbi:unnamed protein product [Rhizoctonia solani]|uniref:Uncharacterized protein n=1 Tax=Rhizoctonia solani TaxID=456999 RepID=A0A8H3DYT1_9AGAM|nr:unnamed protein product [Rhizoctonia solani]